MELLRRTGRSIDWTRFYKSHRTVLITLDAQDTLYKFKKPIATQYIELARQHGVKSNIVEAELAAAFKRSFKAVSKEFPNYGHGTLDSPRAWWKMVVNNAFQQVVPDNDLPESLASGLYDHFATASAYELYPDVDPLFATIRALKQKHRHSSDISIFVGLISNSDPRVKSVLERLGLKVGTDVLASSASRVFSKQPQDSTQSDHYREHNQESITDSLYDVYDPLNDIDFVTTSYAAEIEKPDRTIFEYARQMGLAMELSKRQQWRTSNISKLSGEEVEHDDVNGLKRTLRESNELRLHDMMPRLDPVHDTFVHIGDDYKKDYLGAKNAGWGALYLNREGDDSELETAKDTNPLSSLTEAATVIKQMVGMILRKHEDVAV